MSKTVLKDTKEKAALPSITRKQATRGKKVLLHGYWKGIASTIPDKASRRHYLNMMLDATVSEIESKNKKRKEKEKEVQD
jgi:hypothetical protein